MVYVLGIGLIYALNFCCNNVTNITNRGKRFSRALYIYSSFSVLFLLSACRGYDVGIDTVNYINKFLLIRKHSFGEILSSLYTERVEIGYALINKIVGCFFSNPRVIIVINSAIICYGMANYLYRYSNAGNVAVIIFVCCGLYLHSFNITRQIMACVMMINAWGALTHQKYWKSVLWFLVGVSFHVTSFVFAVTYFYYIFRENRKIVGLTFAASLLVAMFYRPILGWVSQFISTYNYFDNSKNKVSAGGIWIIWVIELVIAAVFIASYFLDDKTRINIIANRETRLVITSDLFEKDTENLICVPIFVVYYIVFTFLGTKFNLLDRFGLYFMAFIIPLYLNFGEVINRQLEKYQKIYWIGLQVCFIGFFLLSIRTI